MLTPITVTHGHMYRWAVLTGGAVLGGLVWLRGTTHVRAVLTGPPPGDLAGLGLSDGAHAGSGGEPPGGAVPMDVALWAFLAVAAAVLLLGAARSRVSRATFRPDRGAGADRTPSAGDAVGR